MDDNDVALAGCNALFEGLRSNGKIMSLSLSQNRFAAKSAAIIADTLLTMRGMVTVNLLNNNICAEQAQHLVTIMKEHPTLKSLCGNNGDETELDMGGHDMDTDGAIMIAPEIVANWALASLDLADNGLDAEDAKHVADAIKGHVSAQRFDPYPYIIPL